QLLRPCAWNSELSASERSVALAGKAASAGGPGIGSESIPELAHTFMVGDGVRVYGGYDGEDSDWLRGGDGYAGTIRKLTANAAAVELDTALELEAQAGAKWQDFGRGSPTSIREVDLAHGRWLTLIHGWVGQTWSDPVRL